MKLGTLSRSIAEAKIPGACAEMEATHVENDSSSSQNLLLLQTNDLAISRVGRLRCKVLE